MMGGIVIASAFWGGMSFPYIDGQYLLQYTIVNYLISLPVGAFIAAMIWPKPAKIETITLWFYVYRLIHMENIDLNRLNYNKAKATRDGLWRRKESRGIKKK